MRVKNNSIKRAGIAIAMLALAMGTAHAQDTLVTRVMKSSYFSNQHYDMDSTWFLQAHGYGATSYGGVGKHFCFEQGEEVNVYGIAAALQTYNLDRYIRVHPYTGQVDSTMYYKKLNSMVDTSYENAYDLWGIYKHVGDSLVLASPRLKVNIKTSPVAYYLDMGTYGTLVPLSDKQYIAMYEMYFNDPQSVSDSFYIYNANQNRFENPKEGVEYKSWPVFPTVVSAVVGVSPESASSRTFAEPHVIRWRYTPESDITWQFRRQSMWMFLIYPILEPDSNGYFCEDTVAQSGGDTLSVQESMLWKSTVVIPNPARGSARVVSGVGLTQVEAYDAAGKRVATQRAEGNETRLDVSAWPEGAYVLRLTTPLGQVYKKLIVRR